MTTHEHIINCYDRGSVYVHATRLGGSAELTDALDNLDAVLAEELDENGEFVRGVLSEEAIEEAEADRGGDGRIFRGQTWHLFFRPRRFPGPRLLGRGSWHKLIWFRLKRRSAKSSWCWKSTYE